MHVTTKHAVVAISALVLSGCAAFEPIRTRNFEGDVQLASLVVDFQDIEIVDDSSGSVFAKIRKARKLVQEVTTMFDREKGEALTRQMVEFQETLIARLRERSGLPLVVTPDTEPRMSYASSAELERIVFTYPETDGATVDLKAKVTYPRTRTTSASVLDDALSARELKVKPRLGVEMRATNTAGDLFWRDTYDYTSDVWYTMTDRYVLGVSGDEIRDSEVYLIPLARGL